MSEGKPDLRDLTRAELRTWFGALRVPAYRGDQVFRWIWRRGARSFDEMTDLPAGLRERLAEEARIGESEVVHVAESEDGTRKLLVRLEDGREIETVMIPDGDRLTLCVSSQVGCALACAFCATGRMGLVRHMRAGEIAWQVVAAQLQLLGDDGRYANPDKRPVTNIVYMGMGEPLHNWEGTLGSLRILTDEAGFGYAPARITVSTVGMVPRMLELGEELPVRLAVSLHAADDETRGRLMPINKKHGLDEVLAACRAFPLKARERITFEYVLLEGVNDRPQDAKRLAWLLEGLKSKVNLIPFNEHEGAPFRRPTMDSAFEFSGLLRTLGVDTFVRTTRGRDIAAACGQLAVAPTTAT